MPINLTNLQAIIQAKVNALGLGADETDLMLLAKTIEATVGNIAVSGIIAQASTSVADVTAAGVAQIASITTTATAKVDAINAMEALLKSGGTMTGPLIGSVGVLTDGATITLDLGQRNNFELTTSGTRTMANPLNPVKGQEGSIEIIGAPVMSWGSFWKFPNGVLPTFTGRSLVSYRVATTSLIEALVMPNFA